MESSYWERLQGPISRRRALTAGATVSLSTAFLAACSGSSNSSSSKPSTAPPSGAAATSAATGAASNATGAVGTAAAASGSVIPAGLAKDHPLIAQYHWSKVSISKNQPKSGGRLHCAVSDPATWDPTDPSATNASNAWGWMYSRLLKPNGRL